ncbi:MAG: hypothetical protein KDK97_05080 [Verrucomicrobiales bacterium]|nr:hypothetical protein [Verrucomicrobiales bacterium]MCP5560457.1 hypothetical protein [Verrucomicrobiaceae bacterium]
MLDSTAASPSILATIATAFRRNRLPCLLLNVVVIALVTSYYRWPAVAGLWSAVGDFKTTWSFGFSLASTIFAAVVLPSTVQWAMGTLPEEGRVRRLLLLALFWGYRGMEIDLLYQFQTQLFGAGNDVGTLIRKVAMDQFVYSPFWAVPTYVIALRWIDHGGVWRQTWRSLDRRFWTYTLPSVMITNWIVWIPAVALIYSLPGPLQFPLFSMVMCFFVLLVTLLAKGGEGGKEVPLNDLPPP